MVATGKGGQTGTVTPTPPHLPLSTMGACVSAVVAYGFSIGVGTPTKVEDQNSFILSSGKSSSSIAYFLPDLGFTRHDKSFTVSHFVLTLRFVAKHMAKRWRAMTLPAAPPVPLPWRRDSLARIVPVGALGGDLMRVRPWLSRWSEES